MSLFPDVLQMCVVLSADWDSIDGTLYLYERQPNELQWSLAGPPIDVALGKNGMAWGRGLVDVSKESGLHKKEGDGKTPAGIFAMGPAFGDALHQSYAKKMPFLLITEDLECVDDANSKYYNQFVTKETQERDWNSSEKMQEIGPLYATGLVVQHNLKPIAKEMGSAIFMHIWSGKGNGTAGCTVMEENDLNALISWLDTKQNPCLVQLPFSEYELKKSPWGLP